MMNVVTCFLLPQDKAHNDTRHNFASLKDKTEAFGFPFDSRSLGFNTSLPATAAAHFVTADAEGQPAKTSMVVKKKNIPL
jgi:hypothetical protein